jgi:hypothetical protein
LLSEKCVCGAHLHDFWISSARNLNIRGWKSQKRNLWRKIFLLSSSRSN